MRKLYTPVTVGLAIYAILVGHNDFSTYIYQSLSVGTVVYRDKILPPIENHISNKGLASWTMFSIVGFFVLLFMGVAPMAPAWNQPAASSSFTSVSLIAALIYIPLVFYYGYGWINRTVKQAGEIKQMDMVRDSYPNARGWATPWEVSQRFKLPTEGEYSDLNMIGIHIGNAIHWNELGHILTCGGSGMGKGQCLVLPALLSDGLVRAGTSVVCLDPKGENAAVSAKHLERSGYDVHIINPFDLPGLKKFKKSRWHPFDLVEDGDKDFTDRLAFSLHNRVSKGDNEYFNSRARQYISLYARYVLHLNRQLTTKSELPLIAQLHAFLMQAGEKRERLLSQMATDETFSGRHNAEAILSRLMTKEGSKTEDSIYSTIEEAIDILENERIQDSMSAVDFDMRELCKKPMAVFICVPHNKLRDYAPWIRIFTDTLLNTLNTHWSTSRKILVLLDEFAQLGYVHSFSFAPAILRGYNVTLWPIIQYIGQLTDLYGRDNFETFITNSVVKHWFGGNGTTMDNTTADYIAARMPKTVEVIMGPDGKARGEERPLLTRQEIINYKKIIGEISGLPAPIEIEKVSYKNWKFCQNNADDNPMY